MQKEHPTSKKDVWISFAIFIASPLIFYPFLGIFSGLPVLGAFIIFALRLGRYYGERWGL